MVALSLSHVVFCSGWGNVQEISSYNCSSAVDLPAGVEIYYEIATLFKYLYKYPRVYVQVPRSGSARHLLRAEQRHGAP
eukprot:6192615-Pleurochrysis_carterae.AAC.2